MEKGDRYDADDLSLAGEGNGGKALRSIATSVQSTPSGPSASKRARYVLV